MRLRPTSMLLALTLTAAPIGIRVHISSNGEESVCSVHFNDARALDCKCVKEDLANDCTVANYKWVCIAQQRAAGGTSSDIRLEDDAWRVVDPSY